MLFHNDTINNITIVNYQLPIAKNKSGVPHGSNAIGGLVAGKLFYRR